MTVEKRGTIQQWIAYHALVISAAFPTVWINIPQDVRNSLPQHSMQIICGLVGTIGMVGKVCQIIAERKAKNVPCNQCGDEK